MRNVHPTRNTADRSLGGNVAQGAATPHNHPAVRESCRAHHADLNAEYKGRAVGYNHSHIDDDVRDSYGTQDDTAVLTHTGEQMEMLPEKECLRRERRNS